MPDKTGQTARETLAWIWREFINVLSLVLGRDIPTGEKAKEPRAYLQEGAEEDIAAVRNDAPEDSPSRIADAGMEDTAEETGESGEPCAGLDEYFDEIDGFMDKTQKNPAASGEPNLNEMHRTEDQDDK